jgi:hypothetical protein
VDISTMPAIFRQYMDAWNRHDPTAIGASFAARGTYSDPYNGGPLSTSELVRTCSELFVTLPDLSLSLAEPVQAVNGKLAIQWRMRGTNAGPSRYGPPGHGVVDLMVAEFVVLDEGKIRSVQRYFDQKILLEQMGLQVVVQPVTSGPFRFGTAFQIQNGKHIRPGAFSITWNDGTSKENIQRINEFATLIASRMVEMPGFIGYVGANFGKRLCTITAWETPKAAQQLLRELYHMRAVKHFFTSDLSTAGHTSVWRAERINALWMRCAACARQVDYDQSEGKCACGARLPDPPPYW